jgi:glycosyltransferase involved in cell wall biosynthesis
MKISFIVPAHNEADYLAAGLVRARNAARRRDGLDVWYGERRPDPEPPS